MTNEKDVEIVEYYYNPNLECTCEAIFADTHRSYCKRRNKPKDLKILRNTQRGD